MGFFASDDTSTKRWTRLDTSTTKRWARLREADTFQLPRQPSRLAHSPLLDLKPCSAGPCPISFPGPSSCASVACKPCRPGWILLLGAQCKGAERRRPWYQPRVPVQVKLVLLFKSGGMSLQSGCEPHSLEQEFRSSLVGRSRRACPFCSSLAL